VACQEHRLPVYEVVNGKSKRLDDRVTWTCDARFLCAKLKQVCEAGPGGGTRQ